ncbi:EPIDERMAL PATTERNING FACTOR-LIKE PROTEIN 4 [Salix viminalis]|uniref:Epidermal patterning factor-like protein n=1 Tax=Salix viminalis TaxID=40686 RepID=A0A9Q0ZD64_SALVM|nr:EPIDERMAL PATTERNING FACTOR-LIKE PROTEIN 4 [Salix viminalis]
MGRAKIGFCCHRNRQLILSLLFDLGFKLDPCRAITKLLEPAPEKGVEEEKIAVKAQTIGSRPPRCEKRCNSCEHCEAVQVPIATQAHSRKRSRFSAAISNIAYSRGDGISNYKPMSWKCKCGNLIFNP